MKKIFFIFNLFILSFTFVFAEARNALLIANATYKNFSSLATPVNEARDLKDTLEQLNFKVTIVENASKENMEDALYEFQGVLNKEGGIGFFHYGGHAVQVDGKNYLIPADADIPEERRITTRALDLDEVMASMCADSNIIVLDACRNNPLPAGSGRSATRGLVLSETKPKSSVIIYSAEAGNVAQDGVFTPALTKALLEKKSFLEIVTNVSFEVFDKTSGTQIPGAYAQLFPTIYLAGQETESNVKTTAKEKKEKKNNVKSAEEYNQIAYEAYCNKDYKKAFDNYKASADLNNSTAQCWLGFLYENGYGTNPDYKKAFELFEKSAKQGNIAAQYDVGLYYDFGYGVKQDYEKAIEWYEKAAKEDYPHALNNLGSLYYYGNGVKQNYSKSFDYYSRSAEQDDDIGLYMMGTFYENGYYVKQNYPKALDYYLKSAEQGNDNAQFSVGFFYLNGLSVEENYSEAIKWFEESAIQNNSDAQYHLGFCYDYGYGVEIDYAKAAEWYELSSDNGNISATSCLGYYYEEGIGVKQNLNKAYELYKKAAEYDDEKALNNLGNFYYNGIVVEQNYDKAFELFSKSANKNNIVAYYNLGLCYQYGLGTETDLDTAEYWYQLSYDNGYEYALDKLNELY